MEACLLGTGCSETSSGEMGGGQPGTDDVLSDHLDLVSDLNKHKVQNILCRCHLRNDRIAVSE